MDLNLEFQPQLSLDYRDFEYSVSEWACKEGSQGVPRSPRDPQRHDETFLLELRSILYP